MPHAALLRISGAILIALVLAATRAEAADQGLLLEVELNGNPTGKIAEFIVRDADLLSRRSDLIELGLRAPGAAPAGPDDMISLSQLTGVGWRLDYATQTLRLTATTASLQPTVLRIAESSEPGEIDSGLGATLNFEVATTVVAGHVTSSGLLDGRTFSPWGVVSSGLLFRGGGTPGADATVRLESTYTYAQPRTGLHYRVGDFITGGLDWTRAVRFGGVQITSDFSMRPDLVTFPTPTVFGSAAVPSTLDVLVNGRKLLSRQVGAGPFEAPQLPVPTGAGAITVALTNALGRQVIATLPFYAAATLLAPGLQTGSVQLGAVRRNFGAQSSDYGPLAFAASYRRGLSSRLTMEAAAEGDAGLFMAGAGMVMNAADVIVFNGAAAASTSAAGAGTQVTFGAQHFADRLSLGLAATIASRHFRDVAARNGDPPARLRLGASLGLSLGRFGSASLFYAGLDRDGAPAPIAVYDSPGTSREQGLSLSGTGAVLYQPAQHTHVISASYAVQIGRLSVYLNGYNDLNAKGDGGVLVGLTLPFGPRTSVNASVSRDSAGSGTQAQATRSASTVGELGYRAFVSTGDTSHQFGELAYRAPWALMTAGVDHLGRQTALRTDIEGALSFVDHRLFASNTIYDSFAVVDTQGLGGIHVLNENRDVGHTNAAGVLLVPDLRSFGVNHIALSPLDIPLDVSMDTGARAVRPQDRAGVLVRFPIRISHGALLRLVDETGAALPLGSTVVSALLGGAAAPVGYDGEAYVENLQPQNLITVQRPDGRRCRAQFGYRAAPGTLPVIGPVLCQETRP